MDFIDHAVEKQDQELQAILASHKNRKPGIQANGKCHYCHDPVKDNLLFCDSQCRDDYEGESNLRQRLKKINGR